MVKHYQTMDGAILSFHDNCTKEDIMFILDSSSRGFAVDILRLIAEW